MIRLAPAAARAAVLAVCAVLLAACAGTPEPAAGGAPPPREEIVASPRHQETVEVAHGDRRVRCFLVYPETSAPAPAVVVIHENRGLTDWVRAVTDRLSREGFVAIAPDLLSGAGPGGGDTPSFPDQDAARDALYKLPQPQVSADLAAVADHVRRLPGADGTVAVIGFCWGGSQTFRMALQRADLRAACVFYGTAPDDATIARVRCPVYGFYAQDDARVNATLGATTERMQAAGRTYEPVIYPGTGHAFMRHADDPKATDAVRAARDAAWERLVAVLRGGT